MRETYIYLINNYLYSSYNEKLIVSENRKTLYYIIIIII